MGIYNIYAQIALGDDESTHDVFNNDLHHKRSSVLSCKTINDGRMRVQRVSGKNLLRKTILLFFFKLNTNFVILLVFVLDSNTKRTNSRYFVYSEVKPTKLTRLNGVDDEFISVRGPRVSSCVTPYCNIDFSLYFCVNIKHIYDVLRTIFTFKTTINK